MRYRLVPTIHNSFKNLTPLPGLGRGWGRVRTIIASRVFIFVSRTNDFSESFRSVSRSWLVTHTAGTRHIDNPTEEAESERSQNAPPSPSPSLNQGGGLVRSTTHYRFLFPISRVAGCFSQRQAEGVLTSQTVRRNGCGFVALSSLWQE